jgi:SAM-dependent methyltransferase
MDLKELASAGTARHPWELARADFFCQLLARRVLDRRIGRVLDVGAGDGFFASRLATLLPHGTEIVCFDPNYRPEQLAALADALPPNVRLSRTQPTERADLVLLLDVLEHIEDDGAQLRALIEGALAPGGFVLVSVPAWPSLFGQHDERLAHHRRYTPSAARALLEGCGLKVLDAGGAFHTLLPLRVAQLVWWASKRKSAAAHTGATDVARWRGSERLSRWLLRGLKLDNAVSRLAAERSVELPGLSWWALCQNRVS